MLFNSVIFIFIYLPIVLSISLFIKIKRFNEIYQKIFLIFSSLVFYGFYEIIFLPLIISSIIFNFLISQRIRQLKKFKKKIYLIFAIIINVFILFLFKYSNFFIEMYSNFTSENIDYVNLIFPLALSFFTLQQIAFLVDSYEDKSIEHSFINYCFFVTFFPQLVAGPILLFKDISTQLKNGYLSKISYQNISMGIYLISLGLFKKIIISNFFSSYSDLAFSYKQNLTLMDAWIGSFAFSMQFYYDFSAYSDLAVGLALIFGINIINNFDSPFKALSIIDFWQRWHISLSNFINAYMFVPLVKNLKVISIAKISIITIFIMTIIGFWHGPSLSFIIFGLMHGLALALNRIFREFNFNLGKLINCLLTLNFINISFIFFRTENLLFAKNMIISMFNVKSLPFFSDFFTIYSKLDFLLFLSIFPIFLYIVLINKNSRELTIDFSFTKKNLLTCVVMFVTSAFVLINNYGYENKFIYFQF